MTAPGQPIVSAVVVSHNHLHDLRILLQSISTHATDPAAEVILVDNASQEPIVETIAVQYPMVTVLANETNEGFGKACNAGARLARGAYLLFVNSDVLLQGNPVPSMVQALESDPQVGAVGLTLLNADGTDQPSGFRFPSLWLRIMQLTGVKELLLKIAPGLRSSSSSLHPDFVTGAFFMIKKDLFDSIGGFDEDYFMYVEDADLGYRIRRSGHASILVPSKEVVHLGRHYEDPALGFVFRHMNIGQILFYRKHFGFARLRLLALISVVAFAARWCLASISPATRGHKGLFADTIRLYVRAFVGRLPVRGPAV